MSLYFTLTIWFWVLFLSVARGSGVGLISAVLITALLFRSYCLPWLKIFLTGATAGFVCWLVLSIWLPSLLFDNSELRGATLNSSGRLPLWKEAWAMSWKNFPLGMGPFSWVSHTAITEGFEQGIRYGHPHNMYLFFAAEYGWISVLALFGLGLHAVKQLLPLSKRPEQDSSLIAITASVIAALVHSFFSSTYNAKFVINGTGDFSTFLGIAAPKYADLCNTCKPYKLCDYKKLSYYCIFAWPCLAESCLRLS